MDINETRFKEEDGMKLAVKTLEYTDRCWFDKEDNRIVGDMGFTFEDTPESRTIELGSLVSSIKEYAGDEMVENFGWDKSDNRKDDDIPIYYIYQADFEEEVEEDEEEGCDYDFCTWAADEIEDTRKTVFIGVYASEEEAKALGIDKAIREYDADCEITYFNPDVEIAKYLAEVEKDAIESVM